MDLSNVILILNDYKCRRMVLEDARLRMHKTGSLKNRCSQRKAD